MTTAAAIDSYDTAHAYLWERINYEQTAQMPYRSRSFKLQRMENLLALVGDPHRRTPALHIAGTKGKGSTAAMLDAALRAAGKRVGLYTSPHLDRIEERFVVDGAPCDAATFVRLVQRVQPAVEQMDEAAQRQGDGGPTYFEITTAMAFLLFAEQAVDLAVLEVGLGGRLDSTNVCLPQASIITSISFDHMQQLGHTLSEIAWEKAGVVKPGVPVVSGVVGAEAVDVIHRVAAERGAPLIQRGRDFDLAYHPAPPDAPPGTAGSLDYWPLGESAGLRRDGLRLSLLGAHQASNAALAIATLDWLNAHGQKIPEAAIADGLARARSGAR
ncbi:MAG: bifunctional folylpolyglutamate synthase/dihydrofolate synthase, partial [Planctomycetales bacterium]|nr:bifunctional folylpolyglutamate synthase/dihydrofolate synthase [Planctomycetales bacterium]